MSKDKKLIIHIDGDAFFASCEVSRKPNLKGKPVVVGEERGIVCALSYEAKKLGVTRCMPIFEVRRDFKEVTVLSSHFELYEKIHSHLVKKLKYRFNKVESYSIDECFVEIDFVSEEEIKSKLEMLKKDIQESLGVTFSFGVSYTKTLAKIASKRDKPNGLTILLQEKIIEEVLKDTPIGSVWGIGASISSELVRKNIISAYHFIKTSEVTVRHFWSEPVLRTWHELQGTSILCVGATTEDQKTVQSTISLIQKTNKDNVVYSELSKNIEIASRHLRKSKLFTNSIYFFLKAKYPTSKTFSVSKNLSEFTQNPKTILKEIESDFQKLFDKSYLYKSTGVTFGNLRREEYIQSDLFNIQKRDKDMSSYLGTIDSLNRKFGPWTLCQASSLESVQSRNKENFDRDKKDNYIYGLPFPYMGEVF